MVDKRGPYRTDHLDLLKAMTEEGTCLLGEHARRIGRLLLPVEAGGGFACPPPRRYLLRLATWSVMSSSLDRVHTDLSDFTKGDFCVHLRETGREVSLCAR